MTIYTHHEYIHIYKYMSIDIYIYKNTQMFFMRTVTELYIYKQMCL